MLCTQLRTTFRGSTAGTCNLLFIHNTVDTTTSSESNRHAALKCCDLALVPGVRHNLLNAYKGDRTDTSNPIDISLSSLLFYHGRRQQ